MASIPYTLPFTGYNAKFNENMDKRRTEMREQELRNFFAENPDAVNRPGEFANQLAPISPELGMAMAQTGRDWRRQDASDAMTRQTTMLQNESTRQQIRLRAEEAAQRVSAAQAAQIEQSLAQELAMIGSIAERAQSPEQFAQQMEASGLQQKFRNFAQSTGLSAAVPEITYDNWRDVGAAVLGPFAEVMGRRAAVQPQQPEPTAQMRNLQWQAEQAGLQPGTPEYQEFMRQRGGGVTINNTSLEPAPKGYRYVRDAQGNPTGDLEPIPGGPEDNSEKEAMRGEQVLRQAGIVLDDINAVISEVEDGGLPVTGVFSAARVLPGSRARDVASLLSTIEANIGFDYLQQMREASPTGGALGAVSNQELALLQSTLGSLDPGQSQEQFLRNLRRLRDQYQSIMEKFAAYPGVTAPGQSATPQSQNATPQTLTPQQSRPPQQTTPAPAAPQQSFVPADTPPVMFLNDPSAQAVARRQGITVEQLWQQMSDQGRQTVLQRVRESQGQQP